MKTVRIQECEEMLARLTRPEPKPGTSDLDDYWPTEVSHRHRIWLDVVQVLPERKNRAS